MFCNSILRRIEGKLDKIMADFTALNQAVSDVTTIAASAVTLLGQLATSEADQATVNSLASQLETVKTSLAAAIASATPPAPAAPVEPTP